ncbi:MAG: right-handed parallel beta-helix repeat-containing protein, partial [Candidatus Hodarchaeota archaeon]
MYRTKDEKHRRMMMACIIGIHLIAFSLLSISLVEDHSSNILSTAIKPSTPSAPIDLYGNGALSGFANASGGDGSSWANAVVIEGYEITTNTQPNIQINNTDLYLIIRNCTITNAPNDYTGIELRDCSNVRITNCTFIDANLGVHAISCLNIQITLNIVQNPNRESFW